MLFTCCMSPPRLYCVRLCPRTSQTLRLHPHTRPYPYCARTRLARAGLSRLRTRFRTNPPSSISRASSPWETFHTLHALTCHPLSSTRALAARSSANRSASMLNSPSALASTLFLSRTYPPGKCCIPPGKRRLPPSKHRLLGGKCGLPKVFY